MTPSLPTLRGSKIYSVRSAVTAIIVIACAVLTGCSSTPPPGTYPGGGSVIGESASDTFNGGSSWCKFNARKRWDEAYIGPPGFPLVICWGNCRVKADCELKDGSYLFWSMVMTTATSMWIVLEADSCTTTCVGLPVAPTPPSTATTTNTATDPVPSPAPTP